MDPLLRGIDPWAEPEADGCPECHGDGGDTDIETGEFIECQTCARYAASRP